MTNATTVSVAQFSAGTDKEQNLDRCREFVAEAAGLGARLVVLPEVAMYTDHEKVNDPRGHGENLEGPWVTSLAATAREHGVQVVVGIVEELEGDDRSSNTLVHLDESGEISGVYRKVHLYDAFGYKESENVRPAEVGEPLVFEIDGFRFGAITCYDLRFPESARHLIDHEVDAIVLPAAWVVGPRKEDHWSTLLRARAIENTCYVVAAGQSAPYCTGNSQVIDPMGVVVADAGEEKGLVSAELSAGRMERVREKNPSIHNRRFEVVAKQEAPIGSVG